MNFAADIILANAQPWPVKRFGIGPRDIAIGGGKILRIGERLTTDRATARSAQIVDCHGCPLLPGLIDAHLHFFAFVDSLLSIDLRPHSGVRSIAAIQAAVRRKAEATPRGQWLKGRGYSEFHLDERRHPTRWDLDTVAPDHPVKLTHRSLHAHVLNSSALKLVGIDAGTPEPPKGIIDRDKTGEPTGVLYEMGEVLAARVPRWDAETFEKGVEQAGQELAACGITEFVDATATNDLSRRQLFATWQARRLLPQRVSMMLGAGALQELGPRHALLPEPGLPPVWGIKLILDRTTGEMQPDPAVLTATIQEAHTLGWPVAVHAVEQETLEAALTAFERVLPGSDRKHPGHRIEHASVCPPRLARRMAALGIKVATQPAFIYYHGDRYLTSVPQEQLPHLYPIATWLRYGVTVAGSSDCPVVPPSPLRGMRAAITRQTREGSIVGPEQRVSLEEAIAMYTNGSLAPGAPADLVLLSGDPAAIAAGDLSHAKVQLTMIGGQIVWQAEGRRES
jgi:hypothetical protein